MLAVKSRQTSTCIDLKDQKTLIIRRLQVLISKFCPISISRAPGAEGGGPAEIPSPSMLPLSEQEKHLTEQRGTLRLDAFTHCLISKCPMEVSKSVGTSYPHGLTLSHK